MAIKLVKTTDEGFSIEYWRISPDVSIDMAARTASAAVLVYKDAAARAAGKRPVRVDPSFEDIRRIELSGNDLTAAMATGDTRAAMYGILKALPFFAGSEDI